MAKAKFINIAFNENLTNPDGFPIYPGQDIWKLPDESKRSGSTGQVIKI